METHALIIFAATVVPLICTPAPDILFIASQAVLGGARAGLRAPRISCSLCLGGARFCGCGRGFTNSLRGDPLDRYNLLGLPRLSPRPIGVQNERPDGFREQSKKPTEQGICYTSPQSERNNDLCRDPPTVHGQTWQRDNTGSHPCQPLSYLGVRSFIRSSPSS
jgi:hypothetical protein